MSFYSKEKKKVLLLEHVFNTAFIQTLKLDKWETHPLDLLFFIYICQEFNSYKKILFSYFYRQSNLYLPQKFDIVLYLNKANAKHCEAYCTVLFDLILFWNNLTQDFESYSKFQVLRKAIFL